MRNKTMNETFPFEKNPKNKTEVHNIGIKEINEQIFKLLKPTILSSNHT